MINASPRLRALVAGGAALVAFGITGGAMAAPGGANDQCPGGVYCGPEENVGQFDSGNGKGGGNAYGKPAAGTVGNADYKNPPGQMDHPDTDGNAGYECDTNEGIAQGNPAHTGCVDSGSGSGT